MSKKRGALNELTDRNWDQDDEGEEAGEFKQADKETLKTREIKVAKRRAIGESASGGAFKEFAGFGSSDPKNRGAPQLSLLTKPPPLQTIAATSTTTTLSSESAAANGKNDSSKSTYLSKLKKLNQNVTKWIKDHVDVNPYCLLTPIFDDYAKYLAEIQAERDKDGTQPTNPVFNGGGPSINSTGAKSIAFGNTSKVVSFGETTKVPTTTSNSAFPPLSSFASYDVRTESSFNPSAFTSINSSAFSVPPKTVDLSTNKSESEKPVFGTEKEDVPSAAPWSFSFNPGASTLPSTTGFSFGAPGSGFQFNASSASSSQESLGDKDEEYVPPKPEVSEVREEDAFYTKRCKLYYQKEGIWTEKGVGNLHLKPLDGKTQLLIRADTSLGNILLNIVLAKSLPMNRQGKNNVAMTCIPNPPIDPKVESNKPVSLLIRVKTGEDADEVLAKLQENAS